MNMAVLENQFSPKYSLLSEEMKLYFSSELSGQTILGLAAEYNIPADFVYSLAFLSVNSDFDLTILENKIKSSNLSGVSAKRFYLDFLGRFLLPIGSEIEEKFSGRVSIEAELKKRNIEIGTYQKWVDAFSGLIEEENEKVVDEILDRYEKEVDPKKEREYVLDILTDSLMEILRAESVPASSELNSGFIYLLFNSDGFREEAIKTILVSKELIGTKNIIIEGRELAPSVANWLKDFIKVNGSDLFSDIVLAQYLDNSENVKKLSEKDRDLLSSLLRFYKNVNFFPESMANVLPENWEIFPFRTKEEKLTLKKHEEAPVAPMVEPMPELIPETKPLPKIEVPEALTIAYENKDLTSLKAMLNDYPPLSLVHKAIMEEIKRLEK